MLSISSPSLTCVASKKLHQVARLYTNCSACHVPRQRVIKVVHFQSVEEGFSFENHYIDSLSNQRKAISSLSYHIYFASMVLDECLSWNEHVKAIVSKAGRWVGMLGHVCHYITFQSANAINLYVNY